MFPENWHFNSRIVLKTTKTPVFVFITEILLQTFWNDKWRSVLDVVKRLRLWAYCPNIYTVISARLVLFGHDFSLNESSLSSAASVSPIPPLPTGLVIGRVPRGPRRPRPHSVAISASSSSSCGQLQHSPIRRKLQREKPSEFFRVAESAVKCVVFEFLRYVLLLSFEFLNFFVICITNTTPFYGSFCGLQRVLWNMQWFNFLNIFCYRVFEFDAISKSKCNSFSIYARFHSSQNERIG